jgi:type I restriction enzyme R subunit
MNEAIDENDDASYSRSLIDHSQTNPNSEKNPIHIILVVDKMLTGYDSEYVNALFLDKKLESYRLIQAVSRTTRVSSEEKKTTGFLVAYRTNKDEIEKAFKIYSGDTHVAAQGNVVSNYNERISQINEKISEIKAIVPTPSDMDHPDFFENENKVSSFRKAFTRLKSLMEIFFKYEQHQ